MGWIFVASWLALSVVLIALGKLCGNAAFTAIGATLLLMMAMVGDVAV